MRSDVHVPHEPKKQPPMNTEDEPSLAEECVQPVPAPLLNQPSGMPLKKSPNSKEGLGNKLGGVAVAVGVGVGATVVGVAVGTGVFVGCVVGVAVGTGVLVGRAVGVAVGTGVLVGCAVGVDVGVFVGRGVGVGVGVLVGWDVGVGVGVAEDEPATAPYEFTRPAPNLPT